MTNAKQRKIVRTLCNSVRDHLLSKMDKVPENWDGHELRRWVADEFENQNGLLARGQVRQNHASKRLAAYHNDVATRGL